MRSFRVIPLAAGILACGERPVAPARLPAAHIEITTSPAASITVGASAGQMVVRVTDKNGAPVRGAIVSFAATQGGPGIAPVADTTGNDGTAASAITAATVPGANTIAATVAGVAPASTTFTGVVGATAEVAVAPRTLRLTATQDTALLTSATRDAFGNPTAASVTWSTSDATLASATAGAGGTAVVRVLSRPGQAWIRAASGSVRDSVLVTFHDASSTPCSLLATPVVLAVGDVAPFDATMCVRSTTGTEEYALVSHYSTSVVSVSQTISVSASGVAAPAPVSSAARLAPDQDVPIAMERDAAFETDLRRREREGMTGRADAAREWAGARHAPGSEAAVSKPLREGDLVPVNVNAFEFCANPHLIQARVAAITDGAIVLADTGNPPGGFTDAEYRAFGVAMDTLVNPVDTTAFGSPSDIDNNGRVLIVFTKAVNELTPRGSPSIVLGFYFARDLLPRLSGAGACPGSNVAEMFYVLAADPTGVVGDLRSKLGVQNNVVAAIAHEYQHLINASRRLYVNHAPVDEEVWLNEGLSHIAEELVFYRAAGRSPRQNITGAELAAGSPLRASFDLFQKNNFQRYRLYLNSSDNNSPVALNDVLATRGATWSFLRYLADRARLVDGDFWFRIVNAMSTGTLNLDAALAGTGLTTLSALADWSVSVLADDRTGFPSRYQQPSWDFTSGLPAIGLAAGLSSGVLTDGVPVTQTIRGATSAYLRFAVPAGGEALVSAVGAGGTSVPPGVRLSVVRIK